MIKISTWNVNSVNARLEHLLNWLEQEKPDIALLQELKCVSEAFPSVAIEDLGYNLAIHGQKTYNGVAILSKFPLSDIVTIFPNNPVPDEARYIEAWVNLPTCAIMVASVYVPNGKSLSSEKYELKLEFLEQLGKYYQKLLAQSEMIVIGGDFNIALTELDVYDPVALNEDILFSLREKQQLRKFLSSGLTDSYRMLNPEASQNCYTWWDYRARAFSNNYGIRIDYIFCSPEAAQVNVECFTSKLWRAKEKASDHIPLSAIFEIN